MSYTLTRSLLVSRMLLLLFSLFSLSLSAPMCNDKQTLDLMETCYRKYFSDWGYPDDPIPFPDFFDGFHKNRKNLLKSDGVGALPYMKEYGSYLTGCLSPVADCIVDDTYTLDPLDVKAEEGHSYNTDRRITAYESTDRGYALFTRHFYCLRTCENADESQPIEDKCDGDLADELAAANGDAEKMCRAYDKNMQCFKKMYSDCCGPEGGEFKCEFFKAEWQIYVPACDFTPCDL